MCKFDEVEELVSSPVAVAGNILQLNSLDDDIENNNANNSTSKYIAGFFAD